MTAPALRTGPRPLPLHVAVQTLTWLSSQAALGPWRNGSLPWRPELAAAAAGVRAGLNAVDPDAFAAALDGETRRRMASFVDGVAAYRRHPYRRRRAEAPRVWCAGSSRLLDYGDGDGAPLLLVPSLVNRAAILDLSPKRSLAAALAGNGFRPFLMDWGVPLAKERNLTLGDYVSGRLESALEAVVDLAGRPAGVVGYCMGGLLAVALAQRRPERVAALALMATPWDFHARGGARPHLLEAMAPGIVHLLDTLGFLPVDVLQAMFAGLNPYLTAAKFRRFAAMEAGSERARSFVALEDWVNDGVPLAGPVARECLQGWYVNNTPRRLSWLVQGRAVLPAEVEAPSLVIIPGSDRIVPPASAAALADALEGAERWELAAGHVGMVAGGGATGKLYKPLAEWLDKALR